MLGKADGAEHRSGFIPLPGTVRSQQGEGVSKCLEAALPYTLCQHNQDFHTVKILIMLTDLPRAYICTELQELPGLQQITAVFSDCCSVPASLSLDGTAERFHGWVIFQVGCQGFLPCL